MSNLFKQPENPILNRYYIIQTLEGGMGVVHLCLDQTQDNFPVAIKTFKPEFISDDEARKRFLLEGAVWVNLGYHPNIVQAYRVEYNNLDQAIYLILQLVPSLPKLPDSSLKSLLAVRGSLDYATALFLILGIVRGMKYATSKIPHLVHRDLKPGNILLGSDGIPRITDFGLASFTKGAEIHKIKLPLLHQTQSTDHGVGTPLYMSPEQWKGYPADERMDIYALGCILYEMLTGKSPIHAGGLNGLMEAHLSGQVLRNVNQSTLLDPIKVLLVRCVNPDPQERFRSWKEIESQLFAIYTPVCGRPVPEENAPLEVSQYRQIQRAESYLAIGSSLVNMGKLDEAEKYFWEAVKLGKELVEPTVLAAAYANLGISHTERGQYQDAIPLYEQAIQLQQNLEYFVLAGNNLGNLGNAYFGLRNLDKAQIYLLRALENARKEGNLSDQSRWLGNLGNVSATIGNFQQACTYFEEALELAHKSGDKISEVKLLGGLGMAYERLGNLTNAAKFDKDCIALAQNLGDRKAEGQGYQALGSLYIRTNHLQQAISCLQFAVEAARQVQDEMFLISAKGNLGAAFLSQHRFEEAIDILTEVITIAERLRNQDVLARAHWSLGLSYELKMEFGPAINHLREAVSLFRKLNMLEYPQASQHLLELRKRFGLI